MYIICYCIRIQCLYTAAITGRLLAKDDLTGTDLRRDVLKANGVAYFVLGFLVLFTIIVLGYAQFFADRTAQKILILTGLQEEKETIEAINALLSGLRKGKCLCMWCIMHT